ncbi:DUF3108 domain-containing protein [Xanthobacter sp. TB0139]|uniref:DUF3108 domain-containing protein n=1 Tax=Xanthobacter sp. TB0139 TaxID=3459178 RepID=UPI004039CC90
MRKTRAGVRRALVQAGAILALLPLAAFSTSLETHAAGQLEARYTLTVGGVELGRAAVTVRASDSTYEVSGVGRISGALRAVSSGKGRIAARGALNGNEMVPRVYAMHAESEGKKERARIAMVSGAVTSEDVHPPLRPLPDRVPVVERVLHNIMDPVSGAFIYMPGTGAPLSPKACNRTIPVYDGRQRYDLRLSYARTENVQTKGYTGPALVCRVRYIPVAGHRPNRYTVQYMVDNEDMYVWLAPIEGTRLLAPFKASVATLIGTAVLDATSFKSREITTASENAARKKP